MSNNRDFTGSLILIAIILVISVLVYYLFFYSGSQPQSTSQVQIIDQNISVTPEPSPDIIHKKNKKSSKDLDSVKKDKPDRQPPPKKAEKPHIHNDSNDVQEKAQALDLIRVDMDNLVAFMNQRSLQLFSQEIVTGFDIRDDGNKLTIYVTNTWYYLPPIQKQIMFNTVARGYAQKTCEYRIRSECSTDDFPTINFLNPENREVAKMAAHQPLQIFE